ncbi:MAG TPA: hypothetical protein VD948_02040 [Rhodothermales bacterium]|nr:hypothetical protein [Rhodothermales bacterium]
MTDIPRCGDTVLHRPSGERWVVAYADPETDTLSWAGRPNGRAKLSDCELVRRWTDARHREWVEQFMASRERDHRHGMVAHLYASPSPTGMEAPR